MDHMAADQDFSRLFTALLSDALDSCGEMNQAMPPVIRPLDEAQVMWGRARTASYREVAHVPPGHNPYELEIALIDDLKPGEIAVLACGGSTRIAPWGGLLSTAAKARGAAGCVTDGFVRDIKQIRALGLPVFHGGIAPLDSRGRGEVAAIDVPVRIGQARIEPGDLVFGDADGLVVIPRRIEAEVLKAAFDKLSGEDHTLAALASGEKLAEVFRRFGVL
jgi:regulator of RNase E activity RraA